MAHGFNPQGFVAAPRKGLFRKNPNFGKTVFASSGGNASAAAAPEPTVTRIADVLKNEPAPAKMDAPEPTQTVELDEPRTDVDTSEAATSKDGDAASDAKAKPTPPVETPEADAKSAGVRTRAEIAAAVDMGTTEDLSTAEARVQSEKETETRPAASQTEKSQVATPEGALPTPAFSTRRSAPTAPKSAPDPSRLGSIASRIAMMPDGGAGPSPGRHAPVPAMKVTNGGGAARKPAAAPPGRKSSPVPSIRKVAPPDTGPVPLPANVSHPAPASTPDIEAERMTVFGARRDVQARRGLTILPVLIGLLVAFALAVGIWSAFFLLTPTEDALIAPTSDPAEALAPEPVLPSDTDTALAPAVPPTEDDAPAIDSQADALDPVGAPRDDATDLALIAPPEDATPPLDATPEADAQDPAAADTPTQTAEDTAAVDPSLVPDPNDPLRRPEGASDDGRYAATGVDIAPPSITDAPAADRLEQLFTPQPDGRLRTQDRAAALAPVVSPAGAPSALLPPPPPGERFELNADGLVVATPDGTLSPQGVLVTAGLPPRRPPPAPERPATTPEPPSEADLVIPVNQGEPALRPRSRPSEELQQDAAVESDGETASVIVRLAGLTPRPRPASAKSSPEATETTEEAETVEVARLAPRARPGAIADAPSQDAPTIDAAQIGAAAASAAASALQNLVPAVQAAPVQISPFAVARSQLPKTRPRNFDRTVARVTQQRQAEPVRVAAASAIARPSGPTRGSVAASATVANAINLGKVNLMGVYGTAANRRALVRLPSGRFVKVKVGDRVDGGRVQAIGAEQLSYVKGGRQILLSMPRG
ncbi:hypothetical protein ILP92_04945 [Maribius pontilimi]|uniref:Type IV pilus biogenesis protein PilP n=1 Tax=Palleronia pontilimi TaxID=1964209 RepID=A0A934MC32_9RHOB|nr:hypothetical protein [Palleronia pontilimi]MBJ3762090.1 hypothetical protein [Palleronia pontilimi]